MWGTWRHTYMRSPKGGRRYQKKIAKVFNIHDGKSDFDKKKVFFSGLENCYCSLRAIHLIFLHWYSVLLLTSHIHFFFFELHTLNDIIFYINFPSTEEWFNFEGKTRSIFYENLFSLSDNLSIALCFTLLRWRRHIKICIHVVGWREIIVLSFIEISTKAFIHLQTFSRVSSNFFWIFLKLIQVYFFADSHRAQSFSCYGERCAGWLWLSRTISFLFSVRKFSPFGEFERILKVKKKITWFFFLKTSF